MQKIDLTTHIINYNHRAAFAKMRRYQFPYDPWVTALIAVLLLAGMVGPLILRVYFDTQSIIPPLLFLAGFGVMYFRVRRRTYVVFRAHCEASIRTGQTHVHLSDTGMRVENDGYELKVPWHHVRDVIDGKDGLLVLINGFDYQPIPAADIPEGMAQAELCGQIKAWIEAVNGGA